MRIHTGNHADRPFRIHQAANDWLSVDFLDEWGGSAIIGVPLIECSEDEWAALLVEHGRHGGSLASEWRWSDRRLVSRRAS